MFPLPTLDSTLTVLSAMVTPAVLILATGSLILTTTNRLVRIIDRVREMLPVVGVALLLNASVLLIFESRIALAST